MPRVDRGPLRAKDKLNQGYHRKKTIPQPYSHKDLSYSNNLDEPEEHFELHMGTRVQATPSFQHPKALSRSLRKPVLGLFRGLTETVK